AEDGIRDLIVTGVQTCALPISQFEPESGGAAHFYGKYVYRHREGTAGDSSSQKGPRSSSESGRGPLGIGLCLPVRWHVAGVDPRSEERRVGQGGRLRCAACADK